MQPLKNLLVASMALAAGTSALAIPVTGTIAHDDCTEKDTATQLREYQSSLFGWQVAGAAVSDDAVNAICNGINGEASPSSGTNYGTWGEEGLLTDNITSVVCNPTKPDTNMALPAIRNVSTSIYAAMIKGSFDSGDDTVSSYLCNNLDHSLLGSFNISDNTIIDSVCTSASAQPLAAPIQGTQPNFNAIDAFVTARSTLYALQYASAATSDSTLSQWCARAPDTVSNFNSLDLSGDVVQNTICALEKPPCYVEGQEAISVWNSQAFAILIQSVSSAQGWREWLCQNLQVDAMNGLGLNGTMVLQEACS